MLCYEYACYSNYKTLKNPNLRPPETLNLLLWKLSKILLLIKPVQQLSKKITASEISLEICYFLYKSEIEG